MNFLQVKKHYLFTKKKNIKSYVRLFSIRKSFWKTNKNNWTVRRKTKALKEHENQLVKSGGEKEPLTLLKQKVVLKNLLIKKTRWNTKFNQTNWF